MNWLLKAELYYYPNIMLKRIVKYFNLLARLYGSPSDAKVRNDPEPYVRVLKGQPSPSHTTTLTLPEVNRMHRSSRMPRYEFTATAEVTGKGTAIRIGRVRDISSGGSYIALADTFSKGSLVIVTISSLDAIFQCEATVVHSTMGIGMGLEFRNIAPRFQGVLDAWLKQAER